MNAVIFIGLQASGKSTFYLERFYKTHLRLNRDMLKTRHRERILFDACIASKQPFVLDNTHPTRREREAHILRLKEAGFEVEGYYFRSSIQDCLERNRLRTGKARIPELGIKGTYNKMQRPAYAEGFDRLYYVSLAEGRFQVSEWES